MPLLHWFKREEDLTKAARAPYRLLEPVPSLHYGEEDSPNMLIEGDNLDALKALLPYYSGQVKCIFIDPPYNTKSAFEHYDDNLEHAQWLSMMYPRLELLRELLAEDGSIWITIDDNEAHYLKVLMDEVFGRNRFVAANVWQKRYSRDNNSAIGDVHDYVLCYALEPEKFKRTRNRISVDSKTRSFYRNPNNDPRGPWRLIPMNGAGLRPNQQYPVTTPSGKVIYPPEGRHWSVLEDKFGELVAQGRVYFGKKGDASPGLIRYLSEVDGLVPWTWWPHEEVGHTDESKKEIHRIFGVAEAFDTPKPERLLQRIIHIGSAPGDLVLDSFLGSGTTAAVAHKMGRRWIGIETGEHARTHCLPRLRKVVDGEQGGISQAVGWPETGGGGFRFFRLGNAVFDEQGRIREGIKFEHLAAHVWFSETGTPRPSRSRRSAFLGEHRGTGYYLLYNGILGDRSSGGGNVLTKKLLRDLPGFDGPRVIYGEACLLSGDRLRELSITFKQTPYDIKAR
ncbi:MAG: site-specific DNA-methyltransferase [Burkholderiaceae bacterium]|nr:site-specific DNA-methyltransferase [Burkholderiaceae bacterium]